MYYTTFAAGTASSEYRPEDKLVAVFVPIGFLTFPRIGSKPPMSKKGHDDGPSYAKPNGLLAVPLPAPELPLLPAPVTTFLPP